MHSLGAILQHLLKKGIVDVKKRRGKKTLTVTFLPETASILRELETAQEHFKQAKFAGFSEEEWEQFRRLTEKIKQNIQKIL